MSVYLAKLYKFSVEAGVDHDVAEAAAPPPPSSEALAVELQRLVPGPRHGPVLSLKNGDLWVEAQCFVWRTTFYGHYHNGKFFRAG